MGKKISQAEFALLEILWAEAPLSAREVFERRATAGSLQTVRTMLERLAKKQAVQRQNSHGIGVFVPIITKEAVVAEQRTSFLRQFFQGDPVGGAAAFLADARLNEQDIDFLSELLARKREEKSE